MGKKTELDFKRLSKYFKQKSNNLIQKLQKTNVKQDSSCGIAR